jgi:hypothetical protein
MASGSIWDRHGLEQLIRDILASVASHPNYPVGRYFLTIYQIVLEFNRRHSNIVAALGYPLGGEGAGSFTLTVYFTKELTNRIMSGQITDIEVQYLACQDIDQFTFLGGGAAMHSTTHKAGWPTPMFRLRC